MTALRKGQTEDESGLTRALLEGLIASIEDKLPRRFAALANGVSPKTFEGWIVWGSTGTAGPLCAELARRVHAWEAGNVGRQMRNLHKLASKFPQATEVYLKARFPADFGGHIRETPDEFEGKQRQSQVQDRLLDNPPPRLRAKFAEHGWVKLPQDLSAEDRALILGLIERHEKGALAALSAGEQGPDE